MEKTHFGAVSNFMTIDFSSNFHLSFEEFKFFSSTTSIIQIDFFCPLMTATNIAGPVFLPKTTFVEHGYQFHYWSFEFSIFCFHQRWSHSPIASMLDFQHSTHLVASSFQNFISTIQTKSLTSSGRTSSLMHFSKEARCINTFSHIAAGPLQGPILELVVVRAFKKHIRVSISDNSSAKSSASIFA